MLPFAIQPITKPLSKVVSLPGSKSITNRALLLAALSTGHTTLEGVNTGEDTQLLVQALRQLGFEITREGSSIALHGTGGAIPQSKASLSVGNAGTVARFLLPFLALQPAGVYHLEGAVALYRRPMRPLLHALEQMGTRFEFLQEPYCYPFVMRTYGLSGGNLTLNSTQSSQFISALLLMAPFYPTPLSLTVEGQPPSEPFIDLTLKMMEAWGYATVQPSTTGYRDHRGSAHERYKTLARYEVEGDATAASYFIALGCLQGGRIEVRPYAPATSMQGDRFFLEHFADCFQVKQQAPESFTLEAPKPAFPCFNADFNRISDTFLTAAALAPLAAHPTCLYNIKHVRHQECDRIEAMAQELRRLGQTVLTTDDSLTITPRLDQMRHLSRLAPITVQTYNDHRMAMSLAILGTYDLHGNGQSWLAIEDPSCVNKTFPGFFNHLKNSGC